MVFGIFAAGCVVIGFIAIYQILGDLLGSLFFKNKKTTADNVLGFVAIYSIIFIGILVFLLLG